MKALIVSTPGSGHLNPLLSVGRALLSLGHEVVALSAHALRKQIEGSRVSFRGFPPPADFDLRRIEHEFPGYSDIPDGPERLLWIVKKVFIDPIPAQHGAIQQVLQHFPADIMLADDFFFGALPMLLGPRSERPPVVMLGTTSLHLSRDDGAPYFAGLPLAIDDAQRQEYSAIHELHADVLLGPLDRHLEGCLLRMGVDPPKLTTLDTTVLLPDAYLQLTVPSFEYPRENLSASVRFVGTPPIAANQAPLPPWAHEVDGSRKVVLVTQGTLSNHDFGELVTPALAALAAEPDLLVVVTAGGRASASIPGPIPDNARVADYLPLDWLFPRLDVLVTNGGYGTVNQAMSYGVPIVAGGLSEDKREANARVAWSGVGIDLQTSNPEPEALRAAVRKVVDEPRYRERAKALAAEFATYDTTSEIITVLTDLAGAAPAAQSREGR
jgi:UDP:flavonoid glycosyltransferase YjiC (YdhE family)